MLLRFRSARRWYGSGGDASSLAIAQVIGGTIGPPPPASPDRPVAAEALAARLNAVPKKFGGRAATMVLDTASGKVLYQQGLARAIELTTANGSRFDAEISRVSAKLSLEQACFDLRFALGLNPLDDGPGAPGETERSVK